MKSSFSVKKILILVTILAVPGFLYYLLQDKGKNRYHPLSFFGPKQVANTFKTKRGKKIPDTLYHAISDFKLINQKGDSISFTADSNKITVVNFFFTRCPSFCRSMNKEMSRVAETYRKNNFLRFLSISVDPDFDTSPILLDYSKSYKTLSQWNFLTGNKDLIYKLSRQDFLVDALQDASRPNNFIHSSMLILIDTNKHIRGYYDSNSKDKVDKLIDEIKVLITEELRNVKDR